MKKYIYKLDLMMKDYEAAKSLYDDLEFEIASILESAEYDENEEVRREVLKRFEKESPDFFDIMFRCTSQYADEAIEYAYDEFFTFYEENEYEIKEKLIKEKLDNLRRNDIYTMLSALFAVDFYINCIIDDKDVICTIDNKFVSRETANNYISNYISDLVYYNERLETNLVNQLKTVSHDLVDYYYEIMC